MVISVIISLYNKEKYIKNTVLSVLSQTYQDYELLIINDGSTDNSLACVNSLSDPRIRVINKQNEGVSATRNRGAKEAKGEWLFFLDADDYIYPCCLEELVKLKDEYPLASLYSANYYWIKDGVKNAHIKLKQNGYVDGALRKLWLREWDFRIGSYMVSKQSFIDNGMFDTKMSNGEDCMMMCQYVKKYSCAYSSVVILDYILDAGVLSHNRIDITKTIEWHISFHEGDKYLKLYYGSIFFRRLVLYTIHGDLNHVCSLIKKHGVFSVMFSAYSFVKSLIS